jgi:alpha-galactosidase
VARKITIIGGGSSTFVPVLMKRFVESSALRGSTIALMDVDARRVETMQTLSRRLVEKAGADLTVESTTDQRAALTGADFVIVAISVGGMNAWEADIEIPARYGVYTHVADSIGPGGIMRAFRHVPILASITRDLAEVSPHAYVFNYTNPATANALAMRTTPSVRSLSLCSCSSFPRNAQALAALAGVAPDEIAVPAPVGGLNHCAAVLDVRLKDGRSVLPQIRERATQPVTKWVLDTFGILPYCWTHWMEFYPPLLRLTEPYQGRLQGLAMGFGVRVHDMEHERARVKKWQDLAERWGSGRDAEGDDASFQTLPEEEGIEVVEIIDAIVENRNAVHIVNITNHGAIDNLPAEAVVEVPALIGSYGVEPVHVGPLPEPVAANLRAQFATQQLTVEAALSGDRHLALQALQLDPMTAAVLEPPQTAHLLDELLQAHARYLPQFA